MAELAATADAVLLLVTSMPSTTIVEGAQANLRNIFRGKKIEVEEVDGVDVNNKTLRSEMFALSNLRGQYPQVFIRSGGTLKFVGDAEAVKSLNDCEDIPAEVLRDHPHIETFSKAFAAFLPEAAAPPPPPAPSKRILEGIDNVMPSAHPTHHPSDGANATARGYVILGRHDSWTASPPLTMDINGAPHAVVQEEHDYMVRGLALARLCPTGSLDVVVTCMDGSKVECTIRVQQVH